MREEDMQQRSSDEDSNLWRPQRGLRPPWGMCFTPAPPTNNFKVGRHGLEKPTYHEMLKARKKIPNTFCTQVQNLLTGRDKVHVGVCMDLYLSVWECTAPLASHSWNSNGTSSQSEHRELKPTVCICGVRRISPATRCVRGNLSNTTEDWDLSVSMAEFQAHHRSDPHLLSEAVKDTHKKMESQGIFVQLDLRSWSTLTTLQMRLKEWMQKKKVSEQQNWFKDLVEDLTLGTWKMPRRRRI